tara:strand:- start:7145 stop:8353 length:1209 start_codon:yes stop_codon:yes gene_type:complete
MLIQESIGTAVDAIKANKLRSVLTTLAIIIGTAAVIAMVAMGSSAQQALDDSITDLGARTIYVYPSSSKQGATNTSKVPLDIKDAIALSKDGEIPWQIAPEIRGSKQVKFKSENASLQIVGSTPDFFSIRGYELDSGTTFTENDSLARKRVVVLGSKVANELKTSSRALLNNEILINNISFKVIGTIKEEGAGWGPNPDEQIYTPLYTASDRIFGRETIGSINVNFPVEYSTEEVMIAIERILRREHDIGPGETNNFSIRDWGQALDLQRQATSIFFALIIGIASISLLVGGIGVMNIMLVSVTERTREIGLRKALGATQNTILLQFIIEAITLCLIGGFIGVILGTSIYFLIAFLQEWPIVFPLTAIIGSVTFSAMVGLFFGIWPARRAAKLDPAISLRYE